MKFKVIDVINDLMLFYLFKTEDLNLSGESSCKYKGFEIENYKTALEKAISTDYLNQRLRDIHNPKIEIAYNKIIGETAGGKFLLDNSKSLLDYDGYYTSGYDPYGFVGWHSDTDIFGNYIFIVYQQDKEGYYRYRDPNTNEIITLEQQVGWNIYSHRLGAKKNDTVWHCAWSETPRFTFLLRFDTDEKLNNAIKILEG